MLRSNPGNALVAPTVGMQEIKTIVVSSKSSVDLDFEIFGFNNYYIVGSGIDPDTSLNLEATLKIGGSFLAANYKYHSGNSTTASTGYGVATVSLSDSKITMSTGGASGAGNVIDFQANLNNVLSSTLVSTLNYSGTNVGPTNTLKIGGSGNNTNTGVVQAIRFEMSGGAFDGTFTLYGLKS